MNKIASYLNEHLNGEVYTYSRFLDQNSTDGSVLSNRPEMIAKVANVNDIRKIMRFCSQLAEKGHVLSVVPRGDGSDATGSTTTTGLVIDARSKMNHIVGFDPRQKLVHVQAGIRCSAVNTMLSTHRGLGLANISELGIDGTVGGAINSGYEGSRVGIRLPLAQSVKQLEIVLSNGDILQTDRLSKRDLAKKKGLTTLEGEIYRKIDNLISDNQETVNRLKSHSFGTAGYSGIAKVRAKDGSFDLTPLFIGSQGSLGIVNEAILTTDFVRPDLSVVLSAYSSMESAQSAVDSVVDSKASAINLIDGKIFAEAMKVGKKLGWAPETSHTGAVVVAIYDDFTERARSRQAKKALKKLQGFDSVHSEIKKMDTASLPELYSAISLVSKPSGEGEEVPGVFSGLWLPKAQFDVFIGELRQLEELHGTSIPVFYDAVTGFIDLFPVFDMKKVSSRQNLLKILAELADLVDKLGGALAGRGADGKLKSFANQRVIDNETQSLFQQVKSIFDPQGILNPGVKQGIPVKDLVSQMNDYCRLL